jgi:RNase H-fold protein (predicted Holliday junction resolvase)
MILAIDPGREKCGLAVVDLAGRVIDQRIVPRAGLGIVLPALFKSFEISRVVIGQGTASQIVEEAIKKINPRAELILVQEKYSTLEARQRYWQAHRPRGLWRLVPTSLRVPPVPVDDFAAVILAERYLKG